MEVTLEIAGRMGRPAKPTENAFIKSFNRRLRDDCLNVNDV